MSGDDIRPWQWEALWRSRERRVDDKTLALIEGLCDSLEISRATLLMYVPHLGQMSPMPPVLRSAEFWLGEAQNFIAQGIEAATAGETTKIGSTEGESPVAESDAPK